MAQAVPVPPPTPFFPAWGWIAIAIVLLVGLISVLDKRAEEKRTAELNHDVPLVLADLHSGKINDLRQFQDHCGPADRREDDPASGDIPAHTALFYSRQNLVVLFLRRKHGTPTQEAMRAYPDALFNEPTFWQISPQHFVSAETAVRILRCSEAARQAQ